MRLAFILIAALLLPNATIPQDGIPQKVGTGKYPDGLLNNTDIQDLTRIRIETLKQRALELQQRFESGTISASILHQARQELLMVQLESTSDKQTRLKYIEDSLANAIKMWQLAKAKEEAGLRGGEADIRLTFEEQVFHFRILWLKEKEMP